jgi:hypothetical protein
MNNLTQKKSKFYITVGQGIELILLKINLISHLS